MLIYLFVYLGISVQGICVIVLQCVLLCNVFILGMCISAFGIPLYIALCMCEWGVFV